MAGLAAAVVRLVSFPVGIYVGAMGVWLVGNAPSPGPLVAGLLMLLAGLTALPPTRRFVQVLVGRRLSGQDAAALFAMCFGAASLLNLMFA